MARPKKTDEQKQLAPATHNHTVPSPGIPPVAAAPINHQNKVIDVENFIRVRNSVRDHPNCDLLPPVTTSAVTATTIQHLHHPIYPLHCILSTSTSTFTAPLNYHNRTVL